MFLVSVFLSWELFQVTITSIKKMTDSVNLDNDIPNSLTIGLFNSLEKELLVHANTKGPANLLDYSNFLRYYS